MTIGPLGKVYGVDFSGAKNAGRKIWISGGRINDGTLEIDECFPGSTLPGSSYKRDVAHGALVNFIKGHQDSAFGLDFPFGLPCSLVIEDNWINFVTAFVERYNDELDFKNNCFRKADNREIRRLTDRESNTPWSPYNLRLFRQTFLGIRHVLYPLVSKSAVCVLPMQDRREGVPWLVEVCPASTLKSMGYYLNYKGRSKEHRLARNQILEQLCKRNGLLLKNGEIEQTILDNHGGDALDSVAAAYSTWRAMTISIKEKTPSNKTYMLEGYVFA